MTGGSILLEWVDKSMGWLLLASATTGLVGGRTKVTLDKDMTGQRKGEGTGCCFSETASGPSSGVLVLEATDIEEEAESKDRVLQDWFSLMVFKTELEGKRGLDERVMRVPGKLLALEFLEIACASLARLADSGPGLLTVC